MTIGIVDVVSCVLHVESAAQYSCRYFPFLFCFFLETFWFTLNFVSYIVGHCYRSVHQGCCLNA